MPVNPKDLVIVAPAVPAPVDVSKELAEIDSLLFAPWYPPELRDVGPDHYAGRSYEVTALDASRKSTIRKAYEAVGWRIVVHGPSNSSAYSKPIREFFRFVPPQAVRGSGGG